MRASSFLTLLLFFLSFSAKSQLCADVAYGMFFDGQDVDLPYFVRYSTLTGEQTILKSFPGMYLSRNGYEKGFINNNDNTYFLITDEGLGFNTKLYCLDLNTGNVKNTLSLGTTYNLEYNATTNKLYGIRNVEHFGTHYFSELISIDPATLTITSLYTFIPDTYFQGQSTVIDPVSNILYISTNRQTSVITYDYVMLAYDLTTGILKESTPGGSMFLLAYNCNDGKIYGFANESPTGFYFCNLDLPGMTLHNIAPWDNDHPVWTFNGTLLINADKNQLVCYGTDTGDTYADYPNHYQYNFDLTSGALTNTIKLTQGLANYNRHGIRFNVAWAAPTAQFSHQATCGLEMQFESSCKNNSIAWDFGDPLSGTSNLSNDSQPLHTFSSAGTYTVKLSYSCNPGYQMTKVIHVSEKNCTGTTSDLIIPNLITANNDGINDVFEIIDPASRSIELSIYNSWGGLIYNNSNYSNDWNPEHDGIYYYHVTFAGPEETYEGWVHVMH